MSTTDPDNVTKPPGEPQSTSERSIRSSLTLAVTIPWIVVLVLWLVWCASFITDGVYTRLIASGVRQVSLPAVTALDAVQTERQLSQELLAAGGGDQTALQQQQARTDAAVGDMNRTIESALSSAPAAIAVPVEQLTTELGKLPQIRSRLAAGQVSSPELTDYYNNVFTIATELFDVQSRIVPDTDASQGGIAATALFRSTDLMSRESALISTALTTGRLPADQHLQLIQLNGSYHTELEKNVSYLKPAVRARYERLVSSPEWAQLVVAENKLLQQGEWSDPAETGVSLEEWRRLTDAVGGELTALTRDQADQVSTEAVDNGDNAITTAVAGAIAAGLFALGFFFWTRRRYRSVIDGSLLPRLQRLSAEARELAEKTLPSMMRRVRSGDRVEVESNALQGYGSDEIGQVADAFRAFQQEALQAAINEADTQQGALTFYIGQTRRVQSALGPLPQRLDALLQNEEDPDRLGALFALDESVTQARHVVENQLVLCGAAPGRRWSRPRDLTEILRASAAETKHHDRLRLGHVPSVGVTPQVIGDMLRMFAELFANAASFSPPGTDVHVEAVSVGSGLVVQISDRGVGMTPDARNGANETMKNPPGFASLVRLGDRGEQLGLFTVAQLAERNEWVVEFGTSIYQGVRAEIFIPQVHLVTEDDEERRDSWSGDVPVASASAPAQPLPTRVPSAASGTVVAEPVVQEEPKPEAPRASTEGEHMDRPPLPQRVPYADLPAGFGEDEPTDRQSKPEFAPGLMTFFNADRKSRDDAGDKPNSDDDMQ
ncbi:nitrate- and nitrite sensing domain-containing protein [Saccharopolyspora gloriosae]|uniref:nitrate- and nitrite sensing domain-containing protein n=1 Tax=Saccharopolyspora gloriosae TaxID=455344 RepID=UPI001FB72571|nr:nitrate- and nitrite sensing domain-containing protein [Saccharopolyspora gloriosae]